MIDRGEVTRARVAAEFHRLGIFLITKHAVVEHDHRYCDLVTNQRFEFCPGV